MENKHLPQTVLDEIVTDDNRQMLKAFIPYLPFRGQPVSVCLYQNIRTNEYPFSLFEFL